MAAEVELVGRGAELARIAEALEAGEPGVLLAGPAGVGKSVQPNAVSSSTNQETIVAAESDAVIVRDASAEGSALSKLLPAPSSVP